MLNNDDLNASGSGNNSNSNSKHGGMHIKSEDPATDPLAGVDSSLNNSNFSGVNSGNNSSGPNRSLMSQNSPERIQPLPSNVVNKQSNSMDVSDVKPLLAYHQTDDCFLSVYAAAKSNIRLLNGSRE